LAAAAVGLAWALLAVLSSDPAIGESLFRGYFIQDADEVVRAWQARCVSQNPNIIPYSNLSMPGWNLLLAAGEWMAQGIGARLTMAGRLVSAGFGWACLHHLVRWTQNHGADWRVSLAAVLMVVSCPAFFLLGFSVYPSVTLAALLMMAVRYWSEDRLVTAVSIIAWAPMIRWEGVLLVALFCLAIIIRRRWKLLGIILLPYGMYLGFNAYLYSNPLQPLVYRTDQWQLFHPDLVWETIRPALVNVSLFYSPIVWLLGLGSAIWLFFRSRKKHWIIALAALGMTTALFSINHHHTVWVMRIFATPWLLCVLCVVGAALSTSCSASKRILLGLSIAAVLISTGLCFSKINNQSIPAPGEFRDEPGFHLFIRHTDATEVTTWLAQQPADWIIVNHLNANLMRADPTCRLQNNALRMGTSKMSMDRSFRPTFGLPVGEGLLVFHTMPYGVEGCEEVKRFEKSNMVILRCRNPAPSKTVP